MGAFGPLGALARKAFERRWIDWEPRAGKQPGGFCSGSSLIDESRIFLTFDGAPGDASTLAHELGHAFHGATMAGSRALKVENPEQSKVLLRSVLDDEPGPARDIVALNAGVALYAANVCASMADGVTLAREALTSGKALAKMHQFVARAKELAAA